MIYLIGFAIFFIGFILGFAIAAICAASGRASRMEESILDRCTHGTLKIPPSGLRWSDSPDTNEANPKVGGNTFNDCHHEVSKEVSR